MEDIGQAIVQVRRFLVVHMILAILAIFLVQAELLALSRIVEWAVSGFGIVIAVGFAFGLALTILVAFSFFLPFFQAVKILPGHFLPVDAASHAVIGVADIAFILELGEGQLVPVVVAVLDLPFTSIPFNFSPFRYINCNFRNDFQTNSEYYTTLSCKNTTRILKANAEYEHAFRSAIVLATNFVIVVSLFAIPCHNYPYHVKCHLAYLSYLSPYPTFKTKLHDGTTFTSSEFHLSIIYVAHTSFLLLLALYICMLPPLALLALSFSCANIIE
jgi:hypothetical protein